WRRWLRENLRDRPRVDQATVVEQRDDRPPADQILDRNEAALVLHLEYGCLAVGEDRLGRWIGGRRLRLGRRGRVAGAAASAIAAQVFIRFAARRQQSTGCEARHRRRAYGENPSSGQSHLVQHSRPLFVGLIAVDQDNRCTRFQELD